MSIKTFIIITRIYLYVTPDVQKFLILHRNVLFFIRTLNLIFSEKHICRFAPLVLSSPEWHKSHTADNILFAKENIFCMIFIQPLGGQPVCCHMDSCIKIKHICVSIKTFIIITRIYLYVTPDVQKFLILHRNVLFSIRTLNLIFSEKHICRFAPLVLSSPEQHKSHMDDCILFAKTKCFFVQFCVGHWLVGCSWHMDSCIKIKHIYV